MSLPGFTYNESQPGAMLLNRICTNVFTVKQHCPMLGIVEPLNEVYRTGFACPGSANESNVLPLLDGKRNIVKSWMFRSTVIVEAHVFEL